MKTKISVNLAIHFLLLLIVMPSFANSTSYVYTNSPVKTVTLDYSAGVRVIHSEGENVTFSQARKYISLTRGSFDLNFSGTVGLLKLNGAKCIVKIQGSKDPTHSKYVHYDTMISIDDNNTDRCQFFIPNSNITINEPSFAFTIIMN